MDIESYFDATYINKKKTKNGRTVKPLVTVRPLNEIDAIASRMVEKGCEICITYKPELTSIWNESSLKTMAERTLRRCLSGAQKKFNTFDPSIILISEHSNTGRFHWHGVINGIPNDVICYISRCLNRNIGRTVIKGIQYTESYHKYMFKSYSGLNTVNHLENEYYKEQYGKDRSELHHVLQETWKEYSYITINV